MQARRVGTYACAEFPFASEVKKYTNPLTLMTTARGQHVRHLNATGDTYRSQVLHTYARQRVLLTVMLTILLT